MGKIADIVNSPEFAAKSPLERAQARRDLFALALDEHPEIKTQFEAADDAGKQTLADHFKAKLTADFPEAFKTNGWKIEIAADGTKAIYGGHMLDATKPSGRGEKWEGPRAPVYDIATEQILHAAADPANREKFAALPEDTRRAIAPFLYERYGPDKVDAGLFGKPEDFVEREESGAKKTLKFAIPALFRIAPPAVASVTKNPKMIAGAAALGDAAAQSIEKTFGTRATFSPVEMGLSAGLSIIPAATIGKISNPALNMAARSGVRAVEGAAQGAVFEGVRQAVDEGEIDGNKLALSAGLGAGFGSIVGALEPKIAALIAGKTAREAVDTLKDAATRATPEQRAAITAAQQRIEEMLQVSAPPTPEQTAARQADVSNAIATDDAQNAARAAVDANLGVAQPNAELAALSSKLGAEQATAAAENATRVADFPKARAEDIQSTVKAGQLETGETIVLGDDAVKNQLTALDTRPGDAAAERARLEAKVAAGQPQVGDGSVPDGVQMSPQAQRIYDQYGFVSPKLATSLSAGAGGFVYGASGDVEGATAEEQLSNRIQRGLTFGVMGLAGGYMLGKRFLTPTGATPPKPGASVLAEVDKVFEKPAGSSIAGRVSETPEKFRAAFITKFAPLDTLEENVTKLANAPAPTLPMSRKFEQVAGATGKALVDIEDFEKAVLPAVTGNERDFDRLLFLKRTGQRLQQDMTDAVEAARISSIPAASRTPDETAFLKAYTPDRRRVEGWTLDKVDTGLAELEAAVGTKRFAELDQVAAGEFQTEVDRSLRLQVASGRISQEAYNAIKASNDFYAPFRVLRTLEDIDAGRVSPGIDTREQIVKAITGIDDAGFRLDSPTKAAAENIFNGRVLAEKNLKMLELAKLSDVDTGGVFIRKLKPWQQPRKEFETVNYFEGGAPMRLEVAPEVAEAIKGMNAAQTGVFTKFAQKTGAAFRFGATSANLAFQVRNIAFADQPRLLLMSKYGLNAGDVLNPLRVPMDFTAALLSSIKSNVFGAKDGLARSFYESGAAGSTLQDSITRISAKFDPGSLADKSAGAVGDVIDKFEDLTRVLEETTKMMGFKRALRLEGVAKLPPARAAAKVEEIVTEIRNYAGSPDFARGGTVAKDLSMMTLFFNARIQGVASDLSRLGGADGSKAAMAAWLRLGAAAGVPAAYFWFRNHESDNKADFEKVPTWERDNYLMIPRYDEKGAPLYFTNNAGEKVRHYYRIPLRESTHTIAKLTQAGLTFADSKDPAAVAEFAANFAESISPINISGKDGMERAESAASSVNPVARLPVEVLTNRDFFRHRNIVPMSRQGGSPENEYYAGSTPQVFVDAARSMPQFLAHPLRSPLMLQHIAGGLTGGIANRIYPTRRPGDAGGQNPITSIFVRSQYVDNSEAEGIAQGVKKKTIDRRIEGDNAAMSELNKILALPEADRAAYGRELAQRDPDLFSTVLDEFDKRQKNFDSADRIAIGLPIRDGSRADYVRQRLMKIPAAERRAFVEEQFAKGILTDEVWEQMLAGAQDGSN